MAIMQDLVSSTIANTQSTDKDARPRLQDHVNNQTLQPQYGNSAKERHEPNNIFAKLWQRRKTNDHRSTHPRSAPSWCPCVTR
eukprot:6515780-Pyramimonas_sp.AAC.1